MQPIKSASRINGPWGACGDTERPCVLARSMPLFKSPIAHSAEWNIDDRTRCPRAATAEAEDERLLRSWNLQTDEGQAGEFFGCEVDEEAIRIEFEWRSAALPRKAIDLEQGTGQIDSCWMLSQVLDAELYLEIECSCSVSVESCLRIDIE